MADSRLRITELDFDTIKTNLKDYLRAQPEFTDYDFEGSALNAILNLLAYGIHYQAFYTNMVSNEMFIDTAILRPSVVSMAKLMNYTPRSRRASTVKLDVTVNTANATPDTITMARGTKFSATLDSNTYYFIPLDAHITSNANSYVFSDIEMKQGTLLTYRYTVNTSDNSQRFIIPNAAIDTSTLIVRVIRSSSDSNTTVYTLNDDVNDVTDTSTVYYLYETENGKYEIQFGDDVLGKALTNGNIVELDYLVTDGELANDIKSFALSGSIDGYSDVTIALSSNVTSSYSGAPEESIQSIKFTAPKNHQGQNRAVTSEDYISVLKKDYPNIQSVAAWGGEDGDPRKDDNDPVYGKVFISIKPSTGYTITTTAKLNIAQTILKKRNIVTVTPEVIDPDYIYILPTSIVKYDSRLTTRTADQIKTLVLAKIAAYNDTELGDFDKYFRFSKLERMIDFTEPSILNSLNSIKMQKRFEPTLGRSLKYTLKFENGILHPYDGYLGAVTSTGFTLGGVTTYLEDDGEGNIRTYKLVLGEKVIIKANAGTVDYTKGRIVLENFAPTAYVGIAIKVTCEVEENDIIPLRNQILVIEDADISVTMRDDIETIRNKLRATS